jgi:hypothetical protein
MKKFVDLFVNTEAVMPDQCMIAMLYDYPSFVPLQSVISAYKWTLLNAQGNEYSKLLRSILVDATSEQEIKNLEGQYEKRK